MVYSGIKDMSGHFYIETIPTETEGMLSSKKNIR